MREAWRKTQCNNQRDRRLTPLQLRFIEAYRYRYRPRKTSMGIYVPSTLKEARERARLEATGTYTTLDER